jgi:hypothetical protein
VFQWNVTKNGEVAGTWTVNLKDGDGEITKGAPKKKANVTLTLDDDDLMALVAGDVSGCTPPSALHCIPACRCLACSVTLTLDNDDDDVMALVALEASRRTQSPRSVVVALRMCACVALPPPIGLLLSFVVGMHSRC